MLPGDCVADDADVDEEEENYLEEDGDASLLLLCVLNDCVVFDGTLAAPGLAEDTGDNGDVPGVPGVSLSSPCLSTAGVVSSLLPPGRHDGVLLEYAPPASSLHGLLSCDKDVDGDGLVSPLLSLAVSLMGVLVTVVSSLLPCDELPHAKDCDGGGHVPVLLS